MSDKEKTYTKEQLDFIAEYCATYGLEPDQIVFFGDDPKPLFDREATAVLLHRLTDVVGIEDEVVPSVFADTITVQWRAHFKDGTFAGSTGIANFGELKGSETMSQEEIKSLATARAARSALTNKGISLVKLHEAIKNKESNTVKFSGQPTDERSRLLRSVHALGEEKALIFRGDKSEWYRTLRLMYNVAGTDDMLIDDLKDFQARLNTLPDMSKAAA